MAKKSDSFKLAQNEAPQFDQTNYFFMQFCHQNTGFPHVFIACLHLPLARMYFVNVWLIQFVFYFLECFMSNDASVAVFETCTLGKSTSSLYIDGFHFLNSNQLCFGYGYKASDCVLTPRSGKTVSQRLKSDDYNILDCMTRDKSERSFDHFPLPSLGGN